MKKEIYKTYASVEFYKAKDSNDARKMGHGYYFLLSEQSYLMVMVLGETVVSKEVFLKSCDACGKAMVGNAEVVGDSFNERGVASFLCSDGCRKDYAEIVKKKKAEKAVAAWKNRVINEHVDFALHCGVGKRHASCTVENYIGDTSGVEVWLENPTENLLLQSPKAGNGKTHLAIAALKAHASSDKCGKINIVYTTFTELMSDIKSTFDNKDASDSEIISFLYSADILVIDDIGAEKVSDFAQSILYIVLNRRYEDMRPTIMTTNMKSDEVSSQYGSRMLSRMVSGIVVTVDGADDRIRKSHQREIPNTRSLRKTLFHMIEHYNATTPLDKRL